MNQNVEVFYLGEPCTCKWLDPRLLEEGHLEVRKVLRVFVKNKEGVTQYVYLKDIVLPKDIKKATH
jgi:hypothetical protein